MSSVTVSNPPGSLAPASANKTFTGSWQFWGALMVVPYLAVFALFVVYPVIYGFWLAHDPQSYVKLNNDPIFWRTIANTLVFLFVAINLKMLVALGLSGFFLNQRWWIKA